MNRTHPAMLPEAELLSDCDVKRTRGSGPGGQHRNKTDTAIVITHRPSGVSGQASEFRSQERNRRAALQRLKINLALKVRSAELGAVSLGEPNLPELPDDWAEFLDGTKIRISADHPSFPKVLTVVLGTLEGCQLDMPRTSAYLGVSTSQLIKFLKRQPEAFRWLNDQRRSRGMVTFK